MPKSLPIADFGGGITDDYINAPLNQFKRLDNFLINKNRKPISRPGSEFHDIVLSPIPDSIKRINHLKLHDDVLFEFAGQRAFHNVGGTLTEVLGPIVSPHVTGPYALGTGGVASADHAISLATWQNHLFGTTDHLNGAYPRKIYKDEDGDVQVRTVGLPGATYASQFATIIDAFSLLVTRFNLHVADVTLHNAPDATMAGLPTATFSEEELWTALEDARLRLSEHVFGMVDGDGIHQAVEFQDALQNPDGRFNSMAEAMAFVQNLIDVFNVHDNKSAAHGGSTGTYEINSSDTDAAGLQTVIATGKLAGDWFLERNTHTLASGLYTVGSNNYLFGFVLAYEYVVGDVKYIDRSAVSLQQIANIDELIGTDAGYRFRAPAFDNGVDNAWDIDNWKVEVYRSTNNGSVLYLSNTFRYTDCLIAMTVPVGEMPTDAVLINQPRLYTNGGILDNDLPPICKYIVTAGDVTWYLNVKEGNVARPFRMRQAKLLDPDSSPEGLFVDLDGDITGAGVIREVPIVFTGTKTYRVEGFVDAAGRGFSRAKVIAHDIGCLSHNSIVATGDLLYFAGTDGFYVTDGYKVTKISNHLNTTYKTAISEAEDGTPSEELVRKRIFGRLDKLTGRIYWAMQLDKQATDNDVLFVHDPYFGVQNEKGTFTTWSFEDCGSPTALEFVDDKLLRGDKDGYVFAHDDSLTTDLVIDTSEADETLWSNKAIIYDLITAATNFGSEVVRKWVTKLVVVLKNLTNISVQPRSINDDASSSPKDLKEIRFRSNAVWGDDECIWGDPDVIWDYTAMIIAERRFPATHLRCTFKQVQLTNSLTVLFRSDDLETVTTDTAANTATLDDVSLTWPDDVVGYYLAFDTDDYATLFEILERTSDTVLTVDDPLGELTNQASAKWLIKGYRKNERIQVENMSILYDEFGSSLTGYSESEEGSNVA